MSASSDGGHAIEVVIEKLQEIVDDIHKTGEEVRVYRSETSKNAETTAEASTTQAFNETIQQGADNNGQQSREFKNSTQINIVPLPLNSSAASEGMSKDTGSAAKSEANGTSVVITTVRDKTPSQVVLNFPVDAGEFNISNTQGLIDTLQKLNSVLSKNRDSGQKSLLTSNNGGSSTAEVQLYKCAKCDYWSHNKYYLKQHVDLVHNAERVYKCPFCDYAGKRSHSLKEHLVVHSNYRPYVCSQCNASFRKKSHLTSHVKLHSQLKGNMNSVCPICFQDVFENLLALHMHLREAHPAEVYSCDVCQYATYMNKGNITMHMLTHGNPKVYTCSDCEYTALHQRIMEEHIVEKHIPQDAVNAQHLKAIPKTIRVGDSGGDAVVPKIWLKCTECGFTTTEKDALHDHVIAKHLRIQETEVHTEKEDKAPQSAQSKEVFGSVAVKKTPMPVSVYEAALRELNVLEEDGEYENQSVEIKKIREIVQNASPYKCWLCPFECSVGFEFITHTIKHLSTKATDRSNKTVSALVGQPQVVPVAVRPRQANPSPDPPSSAQPYMYDESNNWYQCTLCGYSTELQRSIKAHIWKHTGHKDLDYPMFQNGPLSMYDDSPVPKQREERDVETSVLQVPGKLVAKILQPQVTQTTSASVLSATRINAVSMSTPPTSKPVTVVAAKIVPKIPSITGHVMPKNTGPQEVGKSLVLAQDQTPAGKVKLAERDYVVLRIPSTDLKDGADIDRSIADIVQRMDVIPDEVVIFDPATEVQEVGKNIDEGIVVRTESPEDQIPQLPQPEVNDSPKKLMIAESKSNESRQMVTAEPGKDQRNLLHTLQEKHKNLGLKLVSVESLQNSQWEKASGTSITTSGPQQPPSAAVPKFSVASEAVMKIEPVSIPSTSAGFSGGTEGVPEMSVPAVALQVNVEAEETIKTPEYAAEISIHSQEVSPVASPASAEEDVEVDVESDDSPVSQVSTGSAALREEREPFVPRSCRIGFQPRARLIPRTRSAMRKGSEDTQGTEQQGSPVKTPEMAAEISVHSSALERENSGSQDSSTDDDSQMSGGYNDSDAEIITLLTLLKKGPNFNPACPTSFTGTAASELAKQRLEGLANAVRKRVEEGSSDQKMPESGISSSLLAVIEQLRERTNSTGEDTCEEAPVIGPRLRKRKRKRTEEDFEKLINIEATDEGGYKCLLCHYVHDSLENMRAHMRIHQNRKPHQCSLCDFEGCSSEDLQEHVLQHCKTRSYQCKMCTANFGYKSQLRAHMCAHNDEAKVMVCLLCEFKTTDLAAFREHGKTHSENKQIYLCKICERTFNSYVEISEHVATCEGPSDTDQPSKKTPKREYKCDFCPYIAHTQAILKSHMKMHDKDQNLQCGACGFSAHSIRSLKSHMKRHANDQRFVQQPLEQYKCNLCGYVCHHLPSLKAHMWRHASDKNYDYEQINDVINRALEYDVDAARAERQALADDTSSNRPNYLVLFRCCQCGYESVHKSLLNVHMKTHSDIIQKTLEVNETRLVQKK